MRGQGSKAKNLATQVVPSSDVPAQLFQLLVEAALPAHTL